MVDHVGETCPSTLVAFSTRFESRGHGHAVAVTYFHSLNDYLILSSWQPLWSQHETGSPDRRDGEC